MVRFCNWAILALAMVLVPAPSFIFAGQTFQGVSVDADSGEVVIGTFRPGSEDIADLNSTGLTFVDSLMSRGDIDTWFLGGADDLPWYVNGKKVSKEFSKSLDAGKKIQRASAFWLRYQRGNIGTTDAPKERVVKVVWKKTPPDPFKMVAAIENLKGQFNVLEDSVKNSRELSLNSIMSTKLDSARQEWQKETYLALAIRDAGRIRPIIGLCTVGIESLLDFGLEFPLTVKVDSTKAVAEAKSTLELRGSLNPRNWYAGAELKCNLGRGFWIGPLAAIGQRYDFDTSLASHTDVLGGAVVEWKPKRWLGLETGIICRYRMFQRLNGNVVKPAEFGPVVMTGMNINF